LINNCQNLAAGVFLGIYKCKDVAADAFRLIYKRSHFAAGASFLDSRVSKPGCRFPLDFNYQGRRNFGLGVSKISVWTGARTQSVFLDLQASKPGHRLFIYDLQA